jgi:hypothetical protein
MIISGSYNGANRYISGGTMPRLLLLGIDGGWIMVGSSSTIFISYAREDKEGAKRIYDDLKLLGANVWLDQESLLPGQKWKIAIKQQIRSCRYFLAVLSQNSVNKKGYVQKELAEALDILDEFPESDIFIIPIRLNECKPSHERLNDIHWTDMFPDWNMGLSKICSAIGIRAQNHGDLEALLAKSVALDRNSMYSETLETHKDRIRQFRNSRLEKIIANETPIQLNQQPKIVMHLLPIAGFDPMEPIDIKSVEYIRILQPLGASGWNHRYNFDGLLTYSGQRNAPCDSYLQLFRNGVIETVDSNMLGDDIFGKTIPSKLYERTLISASKTYIKFEHDIGFEPPFLLLISMLGINGYTMAVDPRVFAGQKIAIDRDSLILPDILIEDYESDVAHLLRPAFDALWQATGFRGSLNYDDNDNWVGQ